MLTFEEGEKLMKEMNTTPEELDMMWGDGMSKIKPKHSFKDSRGALWVACSECNRGGNGEQSCSAGWQCKRGGKRGCFSGQLLDTFQEPEMQGRAAQ